MPYTTAPNMANAVGGTVMGHRAHLVGLQTAGIEEMHGAPSLAKTAVLAVCKLK